MAREVLDHLRIVEHRVDPLAPAPQQHGTGLRRVRKDTMEELVGLVGRDRLDAEPVGDGQRDRDNACVEQLTKSLHHELQQPRQVELPGERRTDLLERLELSRPGGRRFVKTRVLDRNSGLRRQERHELLVLLVEVRPALLLREIEVSVGDAA